MALSIRSTLGALALVTGCLPLEGAGDVSGRYAVTYSDGWDVFEDGERVATLQSGEEASATLSEGVLRVDLLCADEATTCPDEALWGMVEVRHPIKAEPAVIEIINQDPAVGVEGSALGGLVAPDGAFTAIAGADPRCGGLAVGTVMGQFTAEGMDEGVVAWNFGPGCVVGGLEVDGELRVEAQFSAQRIDDGEAPDPG